MTWALAGKIALSILALGIFWVGLCVLIVAAAKMVGVDEERNSDE